MGANLQILMDPGRSVAYRANRRLRSRRFVRRPFLGLHDAWRNICKVANHRNIVAASWLRDITGAWRMGTPH